MEGKHIKSKHVVKYITVNLFYYLFRVFNLELNSFRLFLSTFLDLECVPRSNAAPCDTQKNRDDCLTTMESRSLILHGNQLKDSVCVWCEQPCTPDNNNQCEPKAFLEGYEKAKPGITKNYETCLAGNVHL